MKGVFFICVLFAFSACSFVDGYKSRDFYYHEDSHKKNLKIKVPSGFADVKLIFDSADGKEQYYYYQDGALLYFSKNASWPTENDSFISARRNTVKSSKEFVYKGVDKDGLHWKEIQIDKFRFGYSYVPNSRMEQFEGALNSVRLRL